MLPIDRSNRIYVFIKNNNGREALSLARRLERVALIEVRYKLHLTFLHRCKDTKSLPKLLCLRPPIDHPKAWKIAEKTGWMYLRVLISSCHNRLGNIRDKSVRLNEQIKQVLDPPSLDTLRKAILDKCTFERNYKQNRHNKKLGQTNDNQHESIKKRWVINTSERKLTKHEIALLRKVMNFALAPKNVPIKEIIASVEQGIKDLPSDEKNEVREKVCAAVKYAKCSQKKIFRVWRKKH